MHSLSTCTYVRTYKVLPTIPVSVHVALLWACQWLANGSGLLRGASGDRASVCVCMYVYTYGKCCSECTYLFLQSLLAYLLTGFLVHSVLCLWCLSLPPNLTCESIRSGGYHHHKLFSLWYISFALLYVYTHTHTHKHTILLLCCIHVHMTVCGYSVCVHVCWLRSA